jgi:HK97 family phage major capsid protein
MKYLELLRAKRAEMEATRAAEIVAMEAALEAATLEGRSVLEPEEEEAATELRSKVAVIDAELAKVDAQIAEFEKIGERAVSAASAPQVMKQVATGFDGDVRYMRPSEARDIARKVIDDAKNTSHLRDDQLEKVEALLGRSDANINGAELAKMILVTETPAYRSAFAKATLNTQPVFTADEAQALIRFNELRAASLTNASGGFGVPVLIDPTVILTSQGSLNPFRQIARVETITTNIWKGVSSVGVSWSFDAEAAAVSDDAATLAQPSVTTHMARGFIPYSLEIGDDYPDFAGQMSTLLMSGWDELQAQKFAVGSGSGEPFGIITNLDANTNVEITPTTDGAFGAVDIAKLWGALPDRFKSNATWMMNHDVGNEVSGFSSAGQGSFYTVNLSEGNAPQLKGRPVAFSSYFPDFTGTTGASNLVVCGDFRNFLIADRIGMTVELVPHLFDVTNNRPTGQRGWFARARVGSSSIADNAFRLLQNQ